MLPAPPGAELGQRQPAPLARQGALQHCQRAQGRAQARGVCRAGPAPAVSAPVSDQSVPEGHKGLHGFLYGEGGAEVHDLADEASYTSQPGEDDGSSIVPVGPYLQRREREKLTGVYAVYDAQRALQYVGYTRHIASALRAHLEKLGPERVAHARVMVTANRAMAGRSQLAEQAQRWRDEAGAVPPGNGPEVADWEESSRRPEPVESHEERALKLRKAMGEDLGAGAAPATPSAAERRANTIRAVEGDDWSAVIEGQTAQTLPEGASVDSAPEAGPSGRDAPISTPFARATVHRGIGEGAGPAPPLTVASAERALDEVRPYLIADGGNVEVVAVVDGVVRLRLQGACGTCPSSAGTMKMGIERALKGAFGEALAGVEQLEAQGPPRADVAGVEAHLDVLRPALASYGATAKVLSVEHGVCRVQYAGPPPLAKGIQAAIRDQFPDVRTVECIS